MNPSERKLRRIFRQNRPWYYHLWNLYLERSVLFDVLICCILVTLNYILVKSGRSFFNIEINAIPDILNELISTSLSSGGFVLAALAIIAGIKQTVPELEEDQKPKSGKEFFFNNKTGYSKLIRLYSYACLIFLSAFLYFTIIRASFSTFNNLIIVNLMIGGISFVSLTFLRCIVVLWLVIKIK